MIKRALLLLVSVAAGTSVLHGQGTPISTTRVDWNNGGATQTQFFFRDANGNLLTQGSPTLNSDGDLVQLGYFSMGTTTGSAGSNFLGTWIPITGFGPSNHTSIGDTANLAGRGDGRIGFSTTFHWGTTNGDVFTQGTDNGAYVTQSSVNFSDTVPPNGQVLAIRFYDTTNTSGHYNTVSSDSWLWVSPTDAGTNVAVLLSTSTLEWESVSVFGLTGTEFKTVLPIPEPSTYALIGMGAIGMMALRRRIKK